MAFAGALNPKKPLYMNPSAPHSAIVGAGLTGLPDAQALPPAGPTLHPLGRSRSAPDKDIGRCSGGLRMTLRAACTVPSLGAKAHLHCGKALGSGWHVASGLQA